MTKIIKQAIHQVTQQGIDEFFLKCCQNGDLQSIQGLFLMYKPKKQSPNKLFAYFLKITQDLRLGVDLHYKNDEGIKLACENNQIDIVKFLTKSKNFLKTINRNDSILLAFNRSLKSDNIETAKFIHSLIADKSKDNEKYTHCIYNTFIDACYEGRLDVVKYLLNDSSIPKHWMDHYPRTDPVVTAGFIAACEGGQPNVVNYFTKNYDFDEHFRCLSRSLRVSNIGVMQHFIVDLGFKKDDNFMKNIYFIDPLMLNELYNKRELFHDLETNLNKENIQSTKTTKKLKV